MAHSSQFVKISVLLLTKVMLEEIVRQPKMFAPLKSANFEFRYEELLVFIGITIAMVF